LFQSVVFASNGWLGSYSNSVAPTNGPTELCQKLGIIPPEYRITIDAATIDPENPTQQLYSGNVFFRDQQVSDIGLFVGNVRDVFGKKAAKEAIAREALEFLEKWEADGRQKVRNWVDDGAVLVDDDDSEDETAASNDVKMGDAPAPKTDASKAVAVEDSWSKPANLALPPKPVSATESLLQSLESSGNSLSPQPPFPEATNTHGNLNNPDLPASKETSLTSESEVDLDQPAVLE
jgi:hypothetical protein